MTDTNVYDGADDEQTTDSDTNIYATTGEGPTETSSFLGNLVNNTVLNNGPEDAPDFPRTKTQKIFDDVATQIVGSVGLISVLVSVLYLYGALDKLAVMTGAATMTILASFTIIGLALHIETQENNE